MDVADLAGQPDRAAVQTSAEHEAGSHPAGELDVEHVGIAARGTVLVLGHGAEVGVVVDHHGQVEAPAQLVGGSELVPAGQHRLVDPGRPPVDGARDAEADAEEVGGGHPRLGCRTPDEVGSDVERALAVRVGVHLGLDLGLDRGAAVGDGHPHVPVADVDAGDPTGAQGEGDQQRRTPAPALVRRAPVVGLDDDAALEQLGDKAGHRGPGEARPTGEIGPALRTSRPQQGRDRAEVGGAQLREGVAGHRARVRTFVLEVD